MSARNHRLEGRWLEILPAMPVLPEIPGIATWLKAQELEITADQNPTWAGQHFDPDRFPVVSCRAITSLARGTGSATNARPFRP